MPKTDKTKMYAQASRRVNALYIKGEHKSDKLFTMYISFVRKAIAK
jgi:hypothetical protein